MKKICTLVLFALLCGIVVLRAQNGSEVASNEALQAKVDELQQRLDKLEKRQQTKEKVKEVFAKYLKFSGYIQAAYDFKEEDGTTATSTFHLRRARMSLTGTAYDNKKGGLADYRLQIDLVRQPVIVDLWIRYQPVHQIGLKVGQMKLPISIENTDYASTKLEFINYSLPVQRLARLGSGDMTGISATGRDLGAMLYGGFIQRDGFSILNYEVGVFNGAGINVKDNNKSKDIAARFTIQPLKLLKIAGYYHYGEADVTSLLDKYPGINPADGANLKYVTCHRWGGGVNYSNDYLFARSEYLGGKTGELCSEGVYALVGYKFCKKWTVGVRGEYFDENTKVAGCQSNYSVALSYHPWKYMRVQAEYTFQHYHNLPGSKNANCLYLMLTGLF